MIPLLYDKSARDFTTLGIGSLPEALRCITHEVRNGENAAELEVPITAAHMSEVVPGNILVLPTNPDMPRQAYDITDVEKRLEGLVTVRAVHLSYRLRYSVVRPYTATSAAAACTRLNNKSGTNYVEGNAFSFATDVTQAGSVSFGYRTVKDLLGGSEGSMVDAFGGFYQWDNFAVRLLQRRGQDRGVRILYGKNLEDLTDELTDEDVVTGVWPIFTSGGEVVQTGTTLATASRDLYAYGRTAVVDFAEQFTSTPTAAQLNAAATAWLNGKQAQRRTLAASFIPLHQTIEYADLANVEHIGMDDTVHLHVPAPFNIDAEARVVETYYDVLKDRYERIEIGSIRPTLADAIRAL